MGPTEGEKPISSQRDCPAVTFGDVCQRFDGFFVVADGDQELGRFLEGEDEVAADEHAKGETAPTKYGFRTCKIDERVGLLTGYRKSISKLYRRSIWRGSPIR